MADITGMLQAAAGVGGEPTPDTDPNFNQIVLLLHGDGTNGAQNNTFVDSSTNNFTITRNGNTTQGTFSPFSVAEGEWSNYFDGTGDYLSLGQVSSGGDLDLRDSDFTIECWVFVSNVGDIQDVFASSAANVTGNSSVDFVLRINSTGTVSLGTVSGSSVLTVTSTDTITFNAWNHIAVSRTVSGLFTGYVAVNGAVVSGSVYSTTNNNRYVYVGCLGNSVAYHVKGYISNLRVLKGTALYTSTFTPPTAPLTAVSGTSLLTCQSNRFVDNSSNAFAITRSGDVKVTPFSPFAPTAAYDASVNGGSGYFDGTGDYLSIADNAALEIGASSFCIESWIYLNALPASGARAAIVGKWGTNISYIFQVFNDSGTIKFSLAYSTNGSSATELTQAAAITAGAWYHVALTRDSTTLRFFLNGVQQGSNQTLSATFYNGSSPVNIGRNEAGNSNFPNGYFSNTRLVVGSAVYTSGFTPSTAPLTAIANTSLLLNFTNAGIFDNTGKHVLETVADCAINTTVKKYGTGSMEFDGTGDWLLMPHSPDQQLGTGDFTIEFWVYLATGDSGSNRGLVAKGTSTTGFLVSLNTTEKIVFTFATSTITSTGAITLDAWNHIAVVREGTGSNETKIYIGGTNDGTGTVSTDFNQTSVMYVGANRTGGDPMKGYIDDLRITKGVARYTTTFTPPTKAFPDI